MQKNLFLDLGNVILRVNKKKAIARLSDFLKKEIDDGSIDWQLEKEYETGQLTTREYVAGFNKIYLPPKPVRPEFLVDIWKSAFRKIDSTTEILAQLGQKNNLYLLSNTNAIHFRAIHQEFPVFEPFNQLILSYETGYRKPDPAIYNYALKKTQSTAENSFFVDDLADNVAAAEKLGFHGHQYRDKSAFYQFLSTHSLL